MNSIWLCCDPKPAKSLHGEKALKDGQPSPLSHFGIFTDSPSNIGRYLPRPGTPFETGSTTGGQDVRPMKLAELVPGGMGVCDSPSVGFGFQRSCISGISCAVTIF